LPIKIVSKKILFFLLCLTALCGIVAYSRAFSNYAFYDDEGTLMMSLKRFFDGLPLYDRVGAIYGPAFYLFEWTMHRVAGIPLSHDSVRFVSVFVWLLTTALAFLIVYKITRSLTVAALTHLLVFRAMGFMGVETAHPQEICILLLVTIALVACYEEHRTFLALSLGALTGVAFLAKLNLGAMVVLGVGIAAAAALNPGRWQRVVFVGVVSAAMTFPVILMHVHLPFGPALKFLLVEELSIVGAVLAITRTSVPVNLSWRDIWLAMAGFGVMAVLIGSFVFARGTTPEGMLHWMVILPATRFAQHTSPTWVDNRAFPVALLGLSLSIYFCVKHGRRTALTVAKLTFSLVVILSCALGSQNQLFAFAPSFLWMVVLRPDGYPPARGAFPRMVLACVGVLQILYAYPVGGSQVSLAAVLILIAAIVCLADAWNELEAWRPALLRAPSVALQISVAVCTLILMADIAVAARAYKKYRSLTPLNLAGASRVRLQPQEAEFRQQIVTRALSSCTALLTVPHLFSFNLFTGLPAPEGIYPSGMIDLNKTEQEQIAQEFSRQPRGCILYNEDNLKFWRHDRDFYSEPLVHLALTDFRTVFEDAGYQLKVRK
jgi:hypothetical protein